jgi:hypothetical protein
MLRLFRLFRVLVILFRCQRGAFRINDARERPRHRRPNAIEKKKPGASAGLKSWEVGERSVKVVRNRQERRSAVQVPEQSPEAAVQVPDPSVPDIRPVPVALLSPLETVTVTAPFAPTLPVTLKEALPA